jgi:Xaa-Pro aminopeptidase/Xaa-Pro dipeptidase
VLLFAGGQIARNYPANWSPYRADSTFLFLFAEPEPNAAALFDPKDRSVTLFLDERTPEDALWHGPVPGFGDVKKAHGVSAVEKRQDLAAIVTKKVGRRRLQSLAVPDPRATAEAARLTGAKLDFHDSERIGDPELIAAIARLRLRRAPEELAEMRAAAAVTREAHVVAMARTRPGIYEQELVGYVEGTFARHGCVPAYNTILTVRGEVLHNTQHPTCCSRPISCCSTRAPRTGAATAPTSRARGPSAAGSRPRRATSTTSCWRPRPRRSPRSRRASATATSTCAPRA